MILNRSEALSGKRPVYENLGDMELLLTIFAAPSPPDKSLPRWLIPSRQGHQSFPVVINAALMVASGNSSDKG